jgi:hypothetical protein
LHRFAVAGSNCRDRLEMLTPTILAQLTSSNLEVGSFFGFIFNGLLLVLLSSKLNFGLCLSVCLALFHNVSSQSPPIVSQASINTHFLPWAYYGTVSPRPIFHREALTSNRTVFPNEYFQYWPNTSEKRLRMRAYQKVSLNLREF